ncbi:hypothetical protein CLOM_g11884 [Closterium sp. NIES-68]|nr:hypothetical protein CLOM_g11884 [Closterium sp. NIES-68]GJP69991.1 hypothetical protein CLOP_g981 [Closterium sp. NIES-67]
MAIIANATACAIAAASASSCAVLDPASAFSPCHAAPAAASPLLLNVFLYLLLASLLALAALVAIVVVVASRWAGIGATAASSTDHPSTSDTTDHDSHDSPSANPYDVFRPAPVSPAKARVRAVLKVLIPAAVRAINWAGRQCGAVAPWFRPLDWLIPFDEAAMLRCAQWCTGLSDFGDMSFATAMRLAAKDARENANLSTFGRIAIWLDVQRLLQCRLQLVEHRKQHPEIEDERIKSPLVVLGMPRTGTTLLFNLLSLDSRTFRTPRTWECHHVYPPPQRASYESDPRAGLMEESLFALDALVPDLKHIHHMTARGPQETFELMCYDCTSFVLPFAYLHAPEYLDWFMASHITPTYRFLRWQLQYLQHHGPSAPHWLLKSPEHIFSLPALLEVFPDARVVCTHRDPLRVLPSAHSLMRCFRSLTCEQVDDATISTLWAPHLARALDSMIALREKAAERERMTAEPESEDSSSDDCSSICSDSSRSSSGIASTSTDSDDDEGDGGDVDIASNTDSNDGEEEEEEHEGGAGEWRASLAVDVLYHEFVRDPIAQIRRIYAHYGEELSPWAERRMRLYLAEDAKERKAHRHMYRWEDTHLDKQEQRARFAHYMQHFGVQHEA